MGGRWAVGGRKADDPWRLEWVPKGFGDPHYWWSNETTGVWKKATVSEHKAAVKEYYEDFELDQYQYRGSQKNSRGKGGKAKGK